MLSSFAAGDFSLYVLFWTHRYNNKQIGYLNDDVYIDFLWNFNIKA